MNLDILPTVKSYHKTNTLHKQTCLFIPKGPKFFACFTYLNNKPCCMFVDIQNNTKEPHYVSFKEELSLGTLLYGTLIKNNFVCEHIYFYKNEKVDDKQNQIELIKFVLQNMIKDSEYLGSISFKIPQMSNHSIILEASNLPYSVYGIVQGTHMFILHSVLGGFQIKKRPETEDVYELFTLDDENKCVLYATALVNDFKTSHFLKTLFFKNRITYKNVEFSDDEDDVPNDKNIYVGCLYISEFKKWKPYNLKNQDSLKKILFLEKNNIVI